MLVATLLALQAAPAARDARDLTDFLAGAWNDAEAAYFAEPPRSPRHVLIAGARAGLTVSGDVPGLHGIAVTADEGTVRVMTSGGRAPCALTATRVGEVFRLAADGACPGTHPALVAADTLALSDGTVMRRADPYLCWVSRKKDVGPDEGWTWAPDLALREGETTVLPDEAGASRPVALRLRHVRWPAGRNRDSLVLYVHDDPAAPAISYAWTAPDAERIAINLRWVQASCTRAAEETGE